jgi:uncharacterized protein YndB with AHSA1/START domain
VLDLAVGGGYFACMRSPDGRDFYSTGVYREISRPERIVLSDSFADEDGNIVSADYYGMSEDWPVEAMIEVTLDELEGKTNMTIHHWPLPQGRDREMCEDGWNESIDKLETYLGDSEIY